LERIEPRLYRLFKLLILALLIGVAGAIFAWLGSDAWVRAYDHASCVAVMVAAAMALLGGLAVAVWGLVAFLSSRHVLRSRLKDQKQRELAWDIMMARHLPLED
jgi:ABC-type branched-subunit amino acid transport system permease subunit